MKVLSDLQRIILSSKMIEVLVGSEKRSFTIHKDLLTLHSPYLGLGLQGVGQQAAEYLAQIEPSAFADFAYFIYTGKILVSHLNSPGVATLAELWRLGKDIQCPALQNKAVDLCREWLKESDGPWKFEDVYKCAEKGSKLRKLASHVMAFQNPFVEYDEKSEEFKAWDDLLARVPDVAVDFAKAFGLKWHRTKPWDEQNLATYMEEEVSLEERWENQILSRRTKETIEREAGANCIRSIIELQHLERTL
jgi:hypothetical protein